MSQDGPPKIDEFVYGIWFVGGRDRDWLGTLFIRENRWVFRYRFRYHAEDSEPPHDGKDRKSGYVATMNDDSPGSLARSLEAIAGVVVAIEREYGSKADFVSMECKPDDPKFFFELASKPWAHVQMEKE